MRPINLTKEKKQQIIDEFVAKLAKQLDDGMANETIINFSTKLSEETKDKIEIIYSPSVYLRMQMLVDHYSSEVAWYGLVRKIDEKTYWVYDVKLCKQYVTGGKVDTEDEDTIEFFDSLTDDEAEHLHFQAHSHVNFGTEPSGTDSQNQADIVSNMGKSGFYIFQIWNKKGDINTCLYNLDNNVFYDRKDIKLSVADKNGKTLGEWVEETEQLVVEKRFYPYVYGGVPAVKGSGKRKDNTYLNGYYNCYGGDW